MSEHSSIYREPGSETFAQIISEAQSAVQTTAASLIHTGASVNQFDHISAAFDPASFFLIPPALDKDKFGFTSAQGEVFVRKDAPLLHTVTHEGLHRGTKLRQRKDPSLQSAADFLQGLIAQASGVDVSIVDAMLVGRDRDIFNLMVDILREGTTDIATYLILGKEVPPIGAPEGSAYPYHTAIMRRLRDEVADFDSLVTHVAITGDNNKYLQRVPGVQLAEYLEHAANVTSEFIDMSKYRQSMKEIPLSGD